MARKLMVVLGLITLVTVGFFRLLLSRQFLHDDMTMLFYNINLVEITSWRDCFVFVLQKTKPVTTLVFALSNWWLGFSVVGQHVLSLVLHAAVVVMWYLVLSRLLRRALGEKMSPWIPALVTALYAIAPIHSETLGIAQFRGEILASLFTLIAWYLAPRALEDRTHWSLLAVITSIALAAFSKEVFLVIALALVVWEWATTRPQTVWQRGRRFNAFFLLAIFGSLMWATMYRLYLDDAKGPYSYTGNVGLFHNNIRAWISLSSRALLEGFQKMLTGMDLTVTRLETREGFGSRLTWFSHSLVLIAFLGGLITLFWRAPRMRPLTLAFAGGSLFYLFIPNSNAGSEHYWYFAAAPFFALLAVGLTRWVTMRPAQWMIGGALTATLFISLQSRLYDYRDRHSFCQAELTQHPESWWPWVNWALVQAEEQKSPQLIKALFGKAEALGAGETLVVHKLVAAISMRDVASTDHYLNESYRNGFAGRGLSVLFTRAALMFYRAEETIKALAAARTAFMLYPQNLAGMKFLRRLEAEFYRDAPLQSFMAKPSQLEASSHGI